MALAPTRSRKQRSYSSVAAVWTPEEDELLANLVSKSTNIKWTEIAKSFPNKTAPQVSGRWIKALKPDLVKGSWTREEDEKIFEFIREHGDRDWSKLAALLPGRIGKQCRERWINHLNPAIKHASWTEEEDNLLITLHEQFGNSWAKIAKYFNGRTDNCVKNRWNSTLKRRLERMARGEPALKKRGRKPKNAQQTDICMDIPSPASAGLTLPPGQEIMPLSIPLLSVLPPLMQKNPHPTTLAENRLSLKQLLNYPE